MVEEVGFVGVARSAIFYLIFSREAGANAQIPMVGRFDQGVV